MGKQSKKEQLSSPLTTNILDDSVPEKRGRGLREYAIVPWVATHNALTFLDVTYLNNYPQELPRLIGYSDYDDMEMSIPEVKTALDIAADVACMGTRGDDKAFRVITKDEKILKILEDLIRRTDFYNKIWTIARDVRKYGDDFEEIELDKKGTGIARLKNLSVYTMYRDENTNGELIGFTQRDFRGKEISRFKPEDVLHLRHDRPRNVVPMDVTRHKYGSSLLTPLRRLYPLLIAMEEGMVVGRLHRSQMRYKFVVDITGLSKEEARDTLNWYKKQFKRKRVVNSLSGRLDASRMDQLLDPADDFFVGAREGGAKVDVGTVSEQTTLGNINDVLYFQNKLFAVLKTPKAFMAYEKDVNAKATVMMEDVEFGRTIRRLQSFLAVFVKNVFDVELHLKGIDTVASEPLYEIEFANVSVIDDQRKAELLKVATETGIALLQAGVIDKEYFATELLEIDPDDYKKIKARVEEEEKKKGTQEIDNYAVKKKIDQEFGGGANGKTAPKGAQSGKTV